MMKRAIILVIDSLGIGYMEDVNETRKMDIGANTFQHLLDHSGYIEIPTMQSLGINKILKHPRLKDEDCCIAGWGTLKLQHYGADSYAGHQEIMGSSPLKPLMLPFKESIDKVKRKLEENHYKTVIPDVENPYLVVNDQVIVADNIETDYGQIYNVTAPLDCILFEEVLKIARIVRQSVEVNRVIALGGRNITINDILGSIEKRKDGLVGVNSPKSGVYGPGYQVNHMGLGVEPKNQVSSILAKYGKEVVLIGKMQDVIECEGAEKIPAVTTDDVMCNILGSMDRIKEGLIAATVQETDLAGHAQDVELYTRKLVTVDCFLKRVMEKMCQEDILLITADHGNDPTIGHSQHTREKTFVLAYGKGLKKADLGQGNTLSDIAATVSEYFGVERPENGTSFYGKLKN